MGTAADRDEMRSDGESLHPSHRIAAKQHLICALRPTISPRLFPSFFPGSVQQRSVGQLVSGSAAHHDPRKQPPEIRRHVSVLGTSPLGDARCATGRPLAFARSLGWDALRRLCARHNFIIFCLVWFDFASSCVVVRRDVCCAQTTSRCRSLRALRPRTR